MFGSITTIYSQHLNYVHLARLVVNLIFGVTIDTIVDQHLTSTTLLTPISTYLYGLIACRIFELRLYLVL